ncbi:MAG: peptide deformylase [Bdellovibrionaceae bacterium]|nr:peptide deformylase [Pseudobdellovibrionaceae bacterium]
MALLEILRFPNPLLRNKGKKVNQITEELKKLAENMLETMKNENGVGLAAIQVAQPVRLLVADTSSELSSENEKDSRYSSSTLKKNLVAHIKQPLILFNPEIIKKEGQVIFPEGCLSFPSYFAEVKRAEIVEVKALNKEGKEILIKTDGLLSICLQHEIDHLDGKLFIDHLSPIKAQRLKEEIKKHGYPTKTVLA